MFDIATISQKILTSALAAALTASSQVAPGRHVELRVYFDRAAGRKDDNGVFSKDGYVMLRYIYIYLCTIILDVWIYDGVWMYHNVKNKKTCTEIDCDILVIRCVANKTKRGHGTQLDSQPCW